MSTLASLTKMENLIQSTNSSVLQELADQADNYNQAVLEKNSSIVDQATKVSVKMKTLAGIQAAAAAGTLLVSAAPMGTMSGAASMTGAAMMGVSTGALDIASGAYQIGIAQDTEKMSVTSAGAKNMQQSADKVHDSMDSSTTAADDEKSAYLIGMQYLSNAITTR